MEHNKTKERSSDRILVLRPMEGKRAMKTTGIFDSKLFTGESRCHATMDPQSCLWTIRYSKSGVMPETLKQQFTSFAELRRFADAYFAKRNAEIVDVLD